MSVKKWLLWSGVYYSSFLRKTLTASLLLSATLCCRLLIRGKYSFGGILRAVACWNIYLVVYNLFLRDGHELLSILTE